jgi:hypothetical protein
MRLPGLSSTWMRVSLAPALAFIATATDKGYLYDFWHHLARGEAMVREGGLVNSDRFTFTVPGRTFEDINWLPQVLYFHLYALGGLPLLQLVNSLLLALMMAVVVHLCWRTSHSIAVASALGVFAFFGLWQSLTIRPQTFSLLLFVLLYEVLLLAERRRAWLIACPPLLALWANIHGAYPAGLLLIGSFVAGEVWDNWKKHGSEWRKQKPVIAWGICLLASALATLVNPYGWRVYHFVANTSTVAGGRPIGEWLPPSMELLVGKFWVVSLLAALVVVSTSQSRPTAREVCLMACFLPLAAASARMVAWWTLAIAPILARLTVDCLPQRKTEPETPSFASALCFTAIVAIAVLSCPWLSRYNPLLGAGRQGARSVEQDLERVAYLIHDHGQNGRIFSRFEWGAYLNCALGPSYPVFMDGRIDIYPDDIWSEYADLTAGRSEWQQILDRYQVDYLVLDPTYHAESGLLSQVEKSHDWELALKTDHVRLYGRRDVSSQSAFDRNSP